MFLNTKAAESCDCAGGMVLIAGINLVIAATVGWDLKEEKAKTKLQRGERLKKISDEHFFQPASLCRSHKLV